LILLGQLLEIRLTIAGRHLPPRAAALLLEKDGEVSQILLPSLPIRGGEIRIMPYMLIELLEVSIHKPGVFLFLLFHYTLKSPNGILAKRSLCNIPFRRGGLGMWGRVLNPP
jgi:hypothetical protein